MSVELPAHDGSTVLVGHGAPGRVQVVWWFPRANTPNCIVQARQLVTAWASLAAAGADVVGVSYDTVPDLARWAAALACPFPLCSAALADAEVLAAARPTGDPWRDAVPLRVASIHDDTGAAIARWEVHDVHAFTEQVRSALNVRRTT